MPSLEFKGKQFVHSHHLSVPFRELVVDTGKPLPAKGKKPSMEDNLIICGDNLEALKALLPTHAGKADYKRRFFELLTEHASAAIRAGELELGVDAGQMSFQMLMQDSWKQEMEKAIP